MTYCAILIPQTKSLEKEDKSDFLSSISDKLMSGVTSGGLNIDNVTTVMKNTASLIVDNADELTSKFSAIGLTQLLVDGKITNDDAWTYLTQGFPQALNQTAITMGFQSLEELKTALKRDGGVNVGEFINAFQNAGNALSNLFGSQKNRDNIEGFDIIEVDAVLSEDRTYASETPDRRVQSGMTYQENIHNMPDIFSLNCVIQNGRNYTSDEFEDMICNIRDRKISVSLMLGDTKKDGLVITLFTPQRAAMDGYLYTLEFKKINAGSVELVPLNIPIATNITTVVNKIYPSDVKTQEEVSNGYQQALDETKEAGKSWINGVIEGFKMGWSS